VAEPAFGCESRQGKSVEQLARSSSVGLTTIRRAELAIDKTSLTAANNLVIRSALESVGITFIDANGDGPGLRLRKPTRQKR
jgi:hypothetical protein